VKILWHSAAPPGTAMIVEAVFTRCRFLRDLVSVNPAFVLLGFCEEY
jgi:hypothetical protein